MTALDVSNNTALNYLSCSPQRLYIFSNDLTDSGNSSYPYGFTLSSADISRIHSIEIKASSGSAISYTTDSNTLLFASMPATITYDYDIGNPNKTTFPVISDRPRRFPHHRNHHQSRKSLMELQGLRRLLTWPNLKRYPHNWYNSLRHSRRDVHNHSYRRRRHNSHSNNHRYRKHFRQHESAGQLRHGRKHHINDTGQHKHIQIHHVGDSPERNSLRIPRHGYIPAQRQRNTLRNMVALRLRLSGNLRHE